MAADYSRLHMELKHKTIELKDGLSRITQGRVTFNAAGFHYDYEDIPRLP